MIFFSGIPQNWSPTRGGSPPGPCNDDPPGNPGKKNMELFYFGSHHLVTWVCLKIEYTHVYPQIAILIGKMMIITCGFLGVHYFQTNSHGASRRVDELLGWALNFKRCRRWHTQISSQMWLAQWHNFRILRWFHTMCVIFVYNICVLITLKSLPWNEQGGQCWAGWPVLSWAFSAKPLLMIFDDLKGGDTTPHV